MDGGATPPCALRVAALVCGVSRAGVLSLGGSGSRAPPPPPRGGHTPARCQEADGGAVGLPCCCRPGWVSCGGASGVACGLRARVGSTHARVSDFVLGSPPGAPWTSGRGGQHGAPSTAAPVDAGCALALGSHRAPSLLCPVMPVSAWRLLDSRPTGCRRCACERASPCWLEGPLLDSVTGRTGLLLGVVAGNPLLPEPWARSKRSPNTSHPGRRQRRRVCRGECRRTLRLASCRIWE